MPSPKIDRVKLNQMLKRGKSQKEIAQVFGVTESAISKAKKELSITVVKNVALENAHRIVDKNLDAVAQLQKINNNANEILDLLMRWQRGDDEALQILESQKRSGSGRMKRRSLNTNLKIPAILPLRPWRKSGDSSDFSLKSSRPFMT